MVSADMCEHDWPGSGCKDCRAERQAPESKMKSCVEAARLSIKACGGINSLPPPLGDPEGKSPGHAAHMLSQIYWGKVVGNKAHRWLGWAQCLLVMHGLTTLEQMKQANREASLDEQEG